MWYWFLWLYDLLGLSGALTAWSLVELAVALGGFLWVIVQGVGCGIVLLRLGIEEQSGHGRGDDMQGIARWQPPPPEPPPPPLPEPAVPGWTLPKDAFHGDDPNDSIEKFLNEERDK